MSFHEIFTRIFSIAVGARKGTFLGMHTLVPGLMFASLERPRAMSAPIGSFHPTAPALLGLVYVKCGRRYKLESSCRHAKPWLANVWWGKRRGGGNGVGDGTIWRAPAPRCAAGRFCAEFSVISQLRREDIAGKLIASWSAPVVLGAVRIADNELPRCLLVHLPAGLCCTYLGPKLSMRMVYRTFISLRPLPLIL
jgi:hypothetical protein